MSNRRIAKKKADVVKAAAIEEVKAVELTEEKVVPAEEIAVEEAEEIAVEEAEATAVESVVEAEVMETMETENQEEASKKRGRKLGAKNKSKETKTVKVAKETESNIAVYVETAGEQYKVEKIEEDVRAAWVAEGHRLSSIKNLNIYINMDERMAYYVINDKNTGSVRL